MNYFVWLRITDEGSVPEMRIWSILLIKSDIKWCIHLRRSLFLYFNFLVSVTAGGPESPRVHMKPSSTVDIGRFVAFDSIKIFHVKIARNCNFVSLLLHPLSLFNFFLNYFVWLRITDEGSVREMCIWSILLIKSDMKWCIHLRRRSLFLYSAVTLYFIHFML